MLAIFGESGYRYLHLSCHGAQDALAMTLHLIPFGEFADMVKPYAADRRIFLSTCYAANDGLANELFLKTEAISLIGSNDTIHFAESALMWASFYRLMFREGQKKMVEKEVRAALQSLANVFGLSLNYFYRHDEIPFYKSRSIVPEVLDEGEDDR